MNKPVTLKEFNKINVGDKVIMRDPNIVEAFMVNNKLVIFEVVSDLGDGSFEVLTTEKEIWMFPKSVLIIIERNINEKN